LLSESSSKKIGDTVSEHRMMSDSLKKSRGLLSQIQNQEFLERFYLGFTVSLFSFVVLFIFKQRLLG
jgi:hypothetical protein